MGLGGFLLAGAWSLHKQGASKVVIGVVSALAALSIGGGILWMLPK